MSKFKVGFIGAGGIALTHMKYLAGQDDVELVAAADISERSLARAKAQYNIPHVYTDYRVMLREQADMDAVSVCTPNGLHASNTVDALNAGKHVLVEKPMAMNAAEGREMVETARRNGKQLIVGFQHRFDPRTKLIRDHVRQGTFGKIMYLRAQALRRRGIPNWGVFGRKELQGGGPMIDIGVHILETAHYMIDSPRPVTVTANTWTFLGNKPSEVASVWPNWDYQTYNVEDLAVGMIRFDTGAMLTIEASFVAHIEKDVFNVQIMGEKGGANWDNTQVFLDHGGYMMNMTPAYVPQWEVFEYKMRHFVDVCLGKRQNESPGEAGLRVQQILDGVYASSEKGREVSIE